MAIHNLRTVLHLGAGPADITVGFEVKRAGCPRSAEMSRIMKRTLAAVTMFALVMAQISTLSAGAMSNGVITGTMRGPVGPVAGVRVNVLDAKGTVVGTAITNGTGSYSLEGLPAGTFMVQAVNAAGSVVTTQLVTLANPSMKATGNLVASAAAAPAAAQAAATAGGLNSRALWWVIGASAATVGMAAAVAMEEPASPAR